MLRILTFFFMLGGLSIASTIETTSDMTIEYKEFENNKTYEIKNIKLNCFKKSHAEKELVQLTNVYPLENEILELSENAYISVDEISYKDAKTTLYGSDVFTDDEGYITMTTLVYDFGRSQSGEKIMYTKVFVDYNKEFKMRNQDVLAIRAGDGSVQYFEEDFNCQMTYNRLLDGDTVYNSQVNVDYSSNYGICYLVQLPSDKSVAGVSGTNLAKNWHLYGDYYFIAKSTTFVQACYIHNEKWFGGNLSVSIGALGVNINGSNTTYYGKGINIYA